MYVWIGIDVDSQYDEIKVVTKRAEEEIGFDHSNFTLPLHVSLKISFPVANEEFNSIFDTINYLLASQSKFVFEVKGVELHENICWIRMNESDELNRLSEVINITLLEKHGIPLHEYDLDYQFHTTLFMDDDSAKVRAGYDRIKDVPLPKTLVANRFVIGTSETGDLGTYKVVERIDVGVI